MSESSAKQKPLRLPLAMTVLVAVIIILNDKSFASPPTSIPLGSGGKQNKPQEKSLAKKENCELRISEVNGNLVDGLGDDEFLELQALCNDGDASQVENLGLWGHKVALISGQPSENAPATIIGEISLQNLKLGPKGFLTIGGERVNPKSLGWREGSTVKVINVRSLTPSIKTFFVSKKKSDQEIYPYGIAILRVTNQNEQHELSQISLETTTGLQKPITPEIEHILARRIIDMVVYNQDLQVNMCTFFSRIAPDYMGKEKYILRAYNRNRLPAERPVPPSPTSVITSEHSAGESNDAQCDMNLEELSDQQGTPGSSLEQPSSSTSGGRRRRAGGKKKQPASQTTLTKFVHPPNVQRPTSQPQPHASATFTKKFSMSRCTDAITGFQPEAFKITRPTPHEINACECGIPFIMEAYAPELYTNLAMAMDIDTPTPVSEDINGTCSIAVGLGGGDVDEAGHSNNANEQGLSGQEFAVSKFTERAINTALSFTSHQSEKQIHLKYRDQVSDQHAEEYELLLKVSEKLGLLDNSKSSEQQPSTSAAAGPTSATSKQVEREQDINRRWEMLINSVTKNHPKELVPINYLKKHSTELKEWLQYIPNDRDPKQGTFRCKLCYEHKDTKFEKPVPSNDLSHPAGKIWPSEQIFRTRMGEHHNSALHKAALKLIAEQQKETLKKSVQAHVKSTFEKLSNERQATAKMMTTVYAEAKMYIPFRSHEKMIKLFTKLELHSFLSFNHHKDRMSAARMTSHISEEFHKIFLTTLMKTNNPLSLILDTGVDSRGNDYMSVHIQFLENDKPRNFFYRLLKLGVDVTARGYLAALKNAFEEDTKKYGLREDLWTYVKRNIASVITDGVATFAGRENGFGVLLSQEIYGNGNKDKLFRVHCGAHRLQLATRHAVDAIPELVAFEADLKAVSTFYNNQNAKNLAHITELAKGLHENGNPNDRKLQSITYIFPTRWCVNAELVIKRIINNTPFLLQDLPNIAADTTFSEKTRNVAQGLTNIVTSIDFHAILFFLSDIINNLNFFSAKLQEAGGVFIGKGHYYEDLQNTLDVLEVKHGTRTREFLNQLKCKENLADMSFRSILTPSDRVELAWARVDKSKICQWTYQQGKDPLILRRGNVAGTNTRQSISNGNFNQLRVKILKSLKDQFSAYFPEDQLYKAFDILHGSKLIQSDMLARNYGAEEIGMLAEKFNLPKDTTVNEFQNFAYEFANSIKFSNYKSMSPVSMWPGLLRDRDFTMGANFRTLVRKLLVIAPSSASVERSFSILKHTKSPRRTSLSHSRLEALMRITMNGPDDIDYFPVIHMANTWKGHETGSKPKKRSNPISVDTQANIPNKLLTTQQEIMEIDDIEQARFESQETTRDVFERTLDQQDDISEAVYLDADAEAEVPESDRLGEAEMFKELI